MKKNYQIILIIAAVLVIAGIAAVVMSGAASANTPSSVSHGNSTKTISDMLGRTLVVPQTITRVLSTEPPTTILTYVLAPDKLIGVNFDLNQINGSVYLPEKYRSLPNVGGWYGKTTGNYETFISMNPEVILYGGMNEGNFSGKIGRAHV